MTAEDSEFVLSIRNDISTLSHLHDSRVFSIKQFKEWFLLNEPTWYIIIKDGIACGYIRTKKNGENRLQIGVDIHPDHRRKGIATQAYQVLFDMPENKNVIFELEVLDTNEIAKKIYDTLGFKEISRYEFDNGYNSKYSIVMEKK